PAEMTSPPPGSSLSSTAVTFRWTGGAGVTDYWLWVSTSEGDADLFDQDLGIRLEATVPGLPTDRRAVFGHVWSRGGETGLFRDALYSAAGSAVALAELTTPPPESTLGVDAVRLQWTGGRGVLQYWIYVGTTPGSADLLTRDCGQDLSAVISRLPNAQ